MPAWNRVVHGNIATAIKDARRSRFTANALADETARLNYPVSRSQIANYESGRTQSLDVCDLLVIAGALSVPPLALLYPGLPGRTVDVLPGQQTNVAAAKAAFVGESGLLWPTSIMGQLSQLMEQLNAIQTGIGGMAGAGALTASADAWTLNAAEIRSQSHRRWTPPATSPPEVRRPRPAEIQEPQEQPRQQMTADEVKRLERELNAPLTRTLS
jgi:transcriptional regulator with XRE-family HTH domain